MQDFDFAQIQSNLPIILLSDQQEYAQQDIIWSLLPKFRFNFVQI